MRHLISAAALAVLAMLVMAGSSSAQTYYNHPYYPMGQGYYPGNAGVFGIGPGGRVQYHPSYYAVVPNFGSFQNPSYGPPNITGMPSYPMSESYPAYNGLYGSGYQSGYYAPSAQDPHTALIDVKVPADARLWVEGRPTQQRGTDRAFVSPALEPGKKYSYDIKAQWTDADGRKVERTRHVHVRAGSRVTVDFGAASS